MTKLRVAGLFFFRFWRQSRDQLFAIVGAAFRVSDAERVALATPVEWAWGTT